MEKKESVVIVKNLPIGIGMPKICVSITGKEEEEIYRQAERIKEEKADIAEWRMDYCELEILFSKAGNIIENLMEILKTIPIITTFRTKREGGEQEIEKEQYIKLQKKIIAESQTDFLDIEWNMGESIVENLIEYAHSHEKKIIVSNHEFSYTPDKMEIVKRLCRMQKSGADIPKIAVMPKSSKDVLNLLEATEEMKEKHAQTPIITMSMGEMGKISRISGEVFGSAVTFGCIGEKSAPGQIEIRCLRQMLELMGLSH